MSYHEDCGHDHMDEDEVGVAASIIHQQFTQFPNELLMGTLQAAVTEIFIRCETDADFKASWENFNRLIDAVFISRTQQPESYDEMFAERQRLIELRSAELQRRQMGSNFEEQALGELHQLFTEHGVHTEEEEFRPGNYL